MKRIDPEEHFAREDAPEQYLERKLVDFGKDWGLHLGEDVASGERVFLSEEDRAEHVHIIGSTGEGKSKLMELMIRQDLLAGRGVCLIDPHGRLFKDVVAFCASKRLPWVRDKIILFNPAREDFVVGYDPLHRSSKDISHQVDSMVTACCRVWGAKNMDETPRLKRWLRNIFFTLIDKNLTLVEAQYLVDPADGAMRDIITTGLGEPFVAAQWDNLSDLSPTRFYEQLESSMNRMMEFLAAPRMRRILAQKERSLDFRKIMDEGHILLVNLSSSQRVSEENADTLGSLLVNDFFLTATDRPKGARPFYLYIDEFSRFVNRDIARILDECRKFGLHLTLAHQHLAQLEKEDAHVYDSVMSDAKTKIVFGGLAYDNAEKMAKEIFKFDPAAIKRVIRQTKFRPKETTRTIPSHSETTGESTSEGGSHVTSHGESHHLVSQPFLPGDEQLPGYTQISSKVSSSSHGSGSHEAEGYSESEVPWYEYEEFKEVSSIQDLSLDEQLYLAIQIMRNLKPREALIKVKKERLVPGKIKFVEDPLVTERRIREFEKKRYRNSPFSLSTKEADKVLEGRAELITSGEAEDARVEPGSFRIPKENQEST